ncbi:hypothetical protein V8C44DRAFT_321085 [Trichoderma aethiopicum]
MRVLIAEGEGENDIMVTCGILALLGLAPLQLRSVSADLVGRSDFRLICFASSLGISCYTCYVRVIVMGIICCFYRHFALWVKTLASATFGISLLLSQQGCTLLARHMHAYQPKGKQRRQM